MGPFLKSELFRESSEAERNLAPFPELPDIKPLRSLTDVFNPTNTSRFRQSSHSDLTEFLDRTPKAHKRKLSKSKKLVSKAAGSVGFTTSKSMNFLHLKSAKDSQKRRTSLRNQSLHISSWGDSVDSRRSIFEPDSIDFTMASRSLSDSTRAGTDPFILYPEITVVPEVNSVDASDGHSIWVAIIVTGVLQRIAENTSCGVSSRQSSLSQAETTLG